MSHPHSAICPVTYPTISQSSKVDFSVPFFTKQGTKSVHRQSFVTPNVLDVLLLPIRSVLSSVHLLSRALSFWSRVVHIYLSFKWTQAHVNILNLQRRRREEVWRNRHERAAEAMWRLCVDLRGFYVKAGQFLATRPDFVPRIICKRLSGLMDNVPGMESEAVNRILCRELNIKDVSDVFKNIETNSYIGSASVAQVHRGVLHNGTLVAVKVQHEGAKRLMLSDLANFRWLAQFLQRTELHFDLVSPIDELRAQVSHEFDFIREANMMDAIGAALAASSGVRGVNVPRSIPGLVTQRVLVMTFLSGLPLTKLGSRLSRRSRTAKRIAGRKILRRMAAAYGEMILKHGCFQADAHPGNVVIMNDHLDIGLLDFGQVKLLKRKVRRNFAKLVLGMAYRDPCRVSEAFRNLGILVEEKTGDQKLDGLSAAKGVNGECASSSSRPKQRRSRYTVNEKLAYTMFDTKVLDGVSSSPFEDSSVVKEALVKKFPKELFFLMRTIQIMRGMAAGMNNGDFSLMGIWKPIAKRAVGA